MGRKDDTMNAHSLKTSLPRVARIVERIDESPTIRTLVLDLALAADPGQFVMAWLPGVDEKPFSLVRANPATLTIARVGPFTTSVFALGAGDRLWLRGPLGQPFTLPNPQSPISNLQPALAGPIPSPQSPLLLIAGSYGVAPLHFLTERARAAGWDLNVVIGARTDKDVVFADRFAALGARVAITTDDGSLGQPGLATDAAVRLLMEADHQGIYSCGP